MTILQREAGARMFYEPDKAWSMVLPINHILGRVPLMKAYLEGSDSPTIPSSLARHNNVYFRHGHADRAGSGKGTGSRLFMLNVHMWQYGRPQPRTISIEERHAKLARASQAAGQKRDRFKDLLQDRSARIRATLQVAPFCEVNIVSTCSQHHESLPPLPPSPPAITPTHSRLRRLARTSGGSVSGLLPTRRRRRTRRRAPPGPAALWPGRQCPPPSYMSVLHRRPWAKLPPSCMSVRHRRPWAKSPLEFRTPPAENRAQCFHSQV